MRRRPYAGGMAALAGLLLLASTALSAGSSALYTIDGDSAGDRLGFFVSGAGDVNADGYADVILGAYWDDDNGTNSGSVRVLSGKDGTTLYVRYGDSAGDEFGRVSGAGDVNADGYADFVVGAPGDDDNGTDCGSVRVFSGKTGGALYTFHGDSAGDELGCAVAGAGDVNDDGYDDVVAGARGDDDAGSNAGSARVYSGKDGSTLYTFYGSAAGDDFGATASGAGDVDGDGHADVIVGARLADENGTDSGGAYVFSGDDGTTLYSLAGDSAGDRFGNRVSGAGDVDDDGYDDFIVGDRLDDDNGTDAGTARVYSGYDGDLLYTFDGEQAGDQLGCWVSGAGDVNGDGYADLVVGACKSGETADKAGAAYVFSGEDGTVLEAYYGEAAKDNFGVCVDGAGDVDDDGCDDVVIGAYGHDENGQASGRAYVYKGSGAPVSGSIAGDDFESGGFSGGSGWSCAWTVSGDVRMRTSRDGPHSGSSHVRLRRSSGYLEREVDLSGASNVTLSFWAKVKSFEGSDKAYVKVSSDGTSFTTVKTFTASDSDDTYHQVQIDLGGFSMTDSFRIAFDAQMSGSWDYLYLDDVELTGVR